MRLLWRGTSLARENNTGVDEPSGKIRPKNVTSHDHKFSLGHAYILSSLWTTSLLLFYTLSIPLVLALRESEVGVIGWGETFPARVDLRLPQVL